MLNTPRLKVSLPLSVCPYVANILLDKAAELESSPEQKFQRKWPVTRGERIEELNELSGHYEHITQKDNINAVKDWHSKFLLDQTITNETVFFQQGKRVEWSDLDDDHGVIWEEVSRSLFFILYRLTR